MIWRILLAHNFSIDACLQGRLSNSDVDQRMIKALADLPSDLGLEAVDKFATSNLESVRSKTGFMVRPPCTLSRFHLQVYFFYLSLNVCVCVFVSCSVMHERPAFSGGGDAHFT